MADDIRTKWHEFADAVSRQHILLPSNSGKLVIGSKRPDFEREKFNNVTGAALDIPNYFIAPSCMELLKSESCTESIRALERMGRTDLPDDMAIVEFSDPVRGRVDCTRYFVLVSRREFPMKENEHIYHPYQCNVMMLYRPNYDHPGFRRVLEMARQGRAIPLWDGPRPPEHWAVVPQVTVMLAVTPEGFVNVNGRVMDADEMHFGIIPSPWVDPRSVSVPGDCPMTQECMSAAYLAVRALLMLLRTRGVEQRTVSPERLNRARSKRGQTRIRDHIIVDIGHMVTRTGERVKYDPSKPGHQFQTPHMRGPHEQGYWVGSGAEKKLVKKWIEPYLVNYTDGDPVPTRKRKVLRGPGALRQSAEEAGAGGMV